MKRLWVRLSLAFSAVLILSQLVSYLTLLALAYYIPTTFIDEVEFLPFTYQEVLQIWVSDQLYNGATPEEIEQLFQQEKGSVDITAVIRDVQLMEESYQVNEDISFFSFVFGTTGSGTAIIEEASPAPETTSDEMVDVNTVGANTVGANTVVVGTTEAAPIYPTSLSFPLALFFNSSTIQVILQSLILGLIAGVVTSRWLVKPLGQLIDAVQAFGKRDMSQRVQVKGSQEIEDLMHTFNTMADELEKAEILRSNIFADVSHELRTPLAGLEGSLRASLDQVYDLDERHIANMVMQTQHLIHLVEDLRLLAQAEAHQLPLQVEKIDIHQLIQETTDIFMLQAEEKAVGLTAVLPPKPLTMYADTNRLRQVLHNLLSNALQHTTATDQIRLTVEKQETQISFAVADTGAGIEAQHLPYIFNRFYRTDKARSRDKGGTGLGLAITKALVEAHNGQIEVGSKGLGQGSTFRFMLPQKIISKLPKHII